ncbi:hypothetical protein [Acetobacter senegalensis]|uniref:hypothetical protein n=1 Tax=Acetobacter senegalensis TaxID=446692 RepID=UPI00264E7845|nr:hypothetical protein [Acetobacter senegalensis]MDN7350014.1 hypothetical protein [Acetobacter senegalensis]
MSLISTIRAALSFSAGVAQTISSGISEAAGAEVEKRSQQNLSGKTSNPEQSDGDKKEREKSSQPAVAFTIPEATGPIKEEPFKPEPLPPPPPKPPPLPPKKLAPINNASKQKPLPILAKPPPPRPSPSRPSASQQPRSALGKMAAAREKANAAASEQKQTEKTDGRSL